MTEHGRKMIAPILITIIFLLYLFAYVALIVIAAADTPLVILFGIPVLLLGIGMVYVLYTRIREIRSGEEDDLDNY
jgi:fatty acid desaturase